MYTLIGSTKTRAMRVAWMLEELELDYLYIDAPPRSEAVTTRYGAGKVPVLLDGDTALTDSVAIMTYLADKHGKLTLPAGTPGRALQDGHTQFVNDEMDSLLWTAAKHSFVLPEERRVPEIKAAAMWEFETSLARLEARLGEGPYLMGEQITIPDLLAAHCHRWSVVAKFPAPSPALEAYFKGLRARDAFTRAAQRQPD